VPDSSRYFCAPAEDGDPKAQLESIARRLQEVATDFDLHKAVIAYEHLYQDSLRLGSGAEVRRTGDKGELVKLKANNAKALLKSWVGLMLGAPLTPRPKARNDDVESRSAVKSSTDVLEHFGKELGLETFVGDWVEAGCAFESAFALVSWDPTKGGEVGVDFANGNAAVWSGGLWVELVQRWDVFYDKQYRAWQNVPWRRTRNSPSASRTRTTGSSLRLRG
jgi:hypothetical protein